MMPNNHPFLTLAAALGLATTAYTFTPSDNLTRHCTEKEKSMFESDENLCFIHQYKDKIRQTAKNYQLPPELIGALLYQENDWRLKIQDLSDTASNVIGRIHTSGPGQIRTTTAHQLDSQNSSIDARIVREYEEILNKPEFAIEYIARELNNLKEHSNFDSKTIEGLDLLASQYRTGLQQTPKPNQHGYDVLIILKDKEIYKTLGIETPRRHRQDIQDYLNSTTKVRVQ